MRAVSWTLTRLPGVIFEETPDYGFCVRNGCGWYPYATGVLAGRRVYSELFAGGNLQENRNTGDRKADQGSGWGWSVSRKNTCNLVIHAL
jgi:hypothetical protein